MRHRLTFGLGIAGMLAAAVLAPQASAQELATGVGCDEFACHNDTDDTYRVESTVQCFSGKQMPLTTYLSPHVRNIPVSASCPTITDPPTWEQQPPTMQPDGSWQSQPPQSKPGQVHMDSVASIHHLRAVVDNDPRPSTGSGTS